MYDHSLNLYFLSYNVLIECFARRIIKKKKKS